MPTRPLYKLIKKLEQHSHLDDADRAAILALPYQARTVEAGGYIVREGDKPEHSCIILTGFAYRHKVTGDGERQIISIHMAGDFVDLQNSFLEISDHNVQTLTRAEIGLVSRETVRSLSGERPNIGRAFWSDTLVDASIFREWVVNVGRRNSTARIAHLLCEFAVRLKALGLGHVHSYELPMTQEQIADAAGLTAVHVNRVLKTLERDGLIARDKRCVSIPDWERLASVGDFTSRYLHLYHQAGRAVAFA